MGKGWRKMSDNVSSFAKFIEKRNKLLIKRQLERFGLMKGEYLEKNISGKTKRK
jgi:hypothetical protein